LMAILMGIGASSEANVYAAGQDAAKQMMTHLGGKPQLTLVFSSLRFADPKLLNGIRSVTEGAPLIGCTDSGGIGTWGPVRHAVVVIGLRGPNAGFVTGVAHGISKDPEAAGQRLAQDLKAAEPGAIKAALVFPDGLAPNGSALLRGLHKGLGSNVPIAGGSAGDDYYFQKTLQFFDDDILTDSVPGALFYGEAAVGIGVRHGWVPLGRPRVVTKAKGEIVYELDGKPAVTIYESYFGAQRKSFSHPPLADTAMIYPLGMAVHQNSECLMRHALRVGEKGSLVFSGEFPEGAQVRLMIGGYESALNAAREAAEQAASAIGKNRFKGALVFSSGGRQKMLGSEAQGEIDVIRHSLGGVGVKLGGFYGYGEHAPSGGSNTFHSESVVVVALG
jgi:hypothetical protein